MNFLDDPVDTFVSILVKMMYISLQEIQLNLAVLKSRLFMKFPLLCVTKYSLSMVACTSDLNLE